MGGLHLVERPGNTRRLLVAFVFIAVSCAALAGAGRADGGALTGGFSPTIVGGGADLNGDGVVNGSDDANQFYGDTHIIDGKLDCDAWGAVANQGDAGNGAIGAGDDCSLVGYDGTPDGVTIEVVDGVFQVADGPLPTVFNAGNPDDASVLHSDFAWSALDGRVDSDGDEHITGDDCHFGLVGKLADAGLGDPTNGADILGNPGANECGFGAPAPNTADNGLVDLNDDHDITGADSCSNSCFFGHDVVSGKVQEVECPGYEGDSRHDVIGTSGADVLVGTAGRDIICARGGNDTLKGNGDKDLLLGGGGADDVHGGNGADVLKGQKGKDHLFGNKGNDRLEGGQGSDHCSGGSGNDTFASCEVRHQ